MLFEFVDTRGDFVIDKLPRGVGNHRVFFSEIFRREDLFRSALLN